MIRNFFSRAAEYALLAIAGICDLLSDLLDAGVWID